MKLAAYIVISTCLLIVSLASAQESGLSINAVRVIKGDSTLLEVEVDCNNDASKGTILLGGFAKSRDGLVRSYGYRPAYVPVGQHVKVVLAVTRPPGSMRQASDVLILNMYQGGVEPFLYRTVALPYVWEAIPAIQASSSQDVKRTNPPEFKNSYWSAFTLSFQESDFEALDSLISIFNDPAERDNLGNWKLSAFASAMELKFRNRNWASDMESIKKWQAFNPTSPGAAIAEAIYWRRYAWNIVGGEDNKGVDPFVLQLFKKRMNAGEQVLIDSRSYASNNPLWYQLYIGISSDSAKGDTVLEDIFKEAVGRHPYFLGIYSEMARRWSPRHGKASWEKVDDIIRLAVVNTKNTEGTSGYTLLYDAVNNNQRLEFDLFHDSLASWSTMKDSFEDLIHRYQDADSLNRYAAYACRANDKETFLKVWAKIGDRLNPRLWPNNYSPDLCQRRFLGFT